MLLGLRWWLWAGRRNPMMLRPVSLSRSRSTQGVVSQGAHWGGFCRYVKNYKHGFHRCYGMNFHCQGELLLEWYSQKEKGDNKPPEGNIRKLDPALSSSPISSSCTWYWHSLRKTSWQSRNIVCRVPVLTLIKQSIESWTQSWETIT